MTARFMPCIVLAIAVVTSAMAPALAQSRAPAAPSAAKGPPNAVQGFSQNRDQPVHIEATRLEVRDKDKVATFIGNVQVNQGDTELRCKILVVFYEADEVGSATSGSKVTVAAARPRGEQRIKKLEARGDVVVTQKEQIATGDTALFDMRANTVTMIGNVVLTQGKSVLRGERLVVDMTTGLSRVESGKGGDGRVQGLFLPGTPAPPSPMQTIKPAPGATAPGRPAGTN